MEIKRGNKIDIVLVSPTSTPYREFGLLSAAAVPRPPLNLLNLGAAILEAGYSVSIFDGFTMKGGVKELIEAIVRANPRYLGLTAMTAYIHKAAEIAEQVKKRLPEIPIILGGIHVSTLPDETFNLCKSFDIGVIGEGDITIVELLKALDSRKDLINIPGLVFRANNSLFRSAPRKLIENLDDLPMPAWHLLPEYIQTYQPSVSRKNRSPSAYIVTSRGCPFKCTFCNNVVQGKTFRSYSVDYLMKMIDHLVKVYRIRDLTIYDENLPLKKDRILEFCKRLSQAKYDLTWSCDARVDCINEEILSLMRDAGCRSLWCGMESGNDKILKRYQKGITLQDIERAAELANKYKIKICGSFIIGGPQETPGTIRDTIRFAKKIKIDHFVPFFYTPIPATTDYEKIREYGTVDLNYQSATMTKPIFAPHGMTYFDLYYWYIRAMLSWYLRPHIILRIYRDIGASGVLKMAFFFLFRSITSIIHPIGKCRRSAKYA